MLLCPSCGKVYCDEASGGRHKLFGTTGTNRKQLPSLPETRQSSATVGSHSMSSAVLPESQANNTSMSESNQSFVGRLPPSYAQFMLEYSIFTEYTLLQKQRIPGVYVIPSANSPLVWFGVLFVRQGFYQGAVLRFSVNIPNTFPDCDCPELVFDYPIFHPMIHPESGELDVKRAFPSWRQNINHIWQVLLYARRIFYKIDSNNPLNPEAGLLFDQDIEAFRSRITDTLHRCRERLNDPKSGDDAHSIRFSTLQTDRFLELKSQMLIPKQNESPCSQPRSTGLSWVKNGTLDAFSKDEA